MHSLSRYLAVFAFSRNRDESDEIVNSETPVTPKASQCRQVANAAGSPGGNQPTSSFVIRHSSFVIRLSSFVYRLSSIVYRLSSFVIRHSSFVIRHSSFVFRLSSFVYRLSSIVFRLSSFVFRLSRAGGNPVA